MIYIVDENNVDENGNPIVLFELNGYGSSTFNGTSANAILADNATTANHALLADDIVGGSDYWNGIFNTHGDNRYISKNDAKKAFGPLNPSLSLDERITLLEEKGNSHSNSIGNNNTAIIDLKSRVSALENIDIETKLTNLSDKDDKLEDRIIILENFNIADLISRVEDIEIFIESLKEKENTPSE